MGVREARPDVSANRRKDIADVVDIMTLCPDPDTAYPRAWAEKIDVSDRLREFIPE